jgi:hypothetical protein
MGHGAAWRAACELRTNRNDARKEGVCNEEPGVPAGRAPHRLDRHDGIGITGARAWRCALRALARQIEFGAPGGKGSVSGFAGTPSHAQIPDVMA